MTTSPQTQTHTSKGESFACDDRLQGERAKRKTPFTFTDNFGQTYTDRLIAYSSHWTGVTNGDEIYGPQVKEQRGPASNMKVSLAFKVERFSK